MSTITPAELATALDTDAKTCRKFLRDNAAANEIEIPGKGGRWAIEKRDIRSLKSRFAKWEAAAALAKTERIAAAAARAAQPAADEPEMSESEPTDDAPNESDEPTA